MSTSIVWFRRDLRLADHPALAAGVDDGDDVVGVFVIDPALWDPSGDVRRAALVRCLHALDDSLDGRLVVRHGDPVEVIPALADEVDAAAVHVTADAGPYGRRRDDEVAAALSDAGIGFVRTGWPTVVPPDTIFTNSGSPYKVFTPFSKSWRARIEDDPSLVQLTEPPEDVTWLSVDGDGIPDEPTIDVDLPPMGERAAQQRLQSFFPDGLADYGDDRDRPDRDATSRLSMDLKWGVLHPRQVLDAVDRRYAGADTFVSELCWRDFYADVLFHQPSSARESMNERVGSMTWDRGDDADERFAAWAEGRTGFPIVDAGMRQLRGEGWMHNRVRMIVASFLVKDLHLDWQRGARHFMTWLGDGDLASNSHGWQWAAGTGTDAAPFFRIFNPTGQARKHDPNGDYIRRWVPELADVDDVHEPWTAEEPPTDYPEPIVDHAEERAEALRRYDATKQG